MVTIVTTTATVKRSGCALVHMQPICTHTINLQSAKPSHAYPIIRLPRAFRELAGSKAAIYQTVHDGKLAFLVKILDHPEGKISTGSMCLTEPLNGGIKRSNRFEPTVFATFSTNGGRSVVI